jgi:hypothetical protein
MTGREFQTVLKGGLLLAVLGVVGLAASWTAMKVLLPGPLFDPSLVARLQDPPPRLQVVPRQDLEALRAQQRALLDSYAWVDRQARRVRMPVARAIDLTVRDGLPHRELRR